MKYEETLELYRALIRDLEDVPGQENDELQFLETSVGKIRDSIIRLETYIAAHPVNGPAEELLYFKTVYPMFCAELVYYVERYNLAKCLLVIDATEWSAELNSELKRIADYYKRNKFLYEYYRMGLTELDAALFTSAGESKSRLLPELPAVIRNPAKTASQIFAQIMAYEKLRTFIQLKLETLSLVGTSIGTWAHGKSTLRWTGDGINLVELAYGIWLTGQLNEGNATITEIMEALGNLFKIHLGRPYRRWTEISGRKLFSHTKYIDLMKAAIDKRIDGQMQLH